MTTAAFLDRLRALGVRLEPAEDRLRFLDPQGALTPELRAELARRKLEVLAFFREARAARTEGPALVPGRYDGDARPLSAGQRRLWFLERLHPGSCAYHIPAAFGLVGDLDVDALRRSFETVVARHEPLRTAFVERDGEPAGRLAPPMPFALPVEDVRDGPEGQARMLAEARRPFDLARGPLLRARLFRHAPDRHTLLVTAHHAASDGWSTGVLTRELSACYAAFRTAGWPALPPLPLRYADYASWQARARETPAAAGALAAWVRRLRPELPPLDLPADRPRPAVQRFEGDLRERTPPAALAEGVRRLARAEGASPFMVLLAAYAALLHRYTGRKAFAVGTPVAGRAHVALEGLAGFFVNTLALPLDLAGGPTFRDLLRRVRETALDAFERSDVPFEQLVEVLQPARSLDRPPLVQTLFVHQTAPVVPLTLAGLAPAPVRFVGGTAKVDLTLFVEEDAGGYRFAGEYATALFEPTTVDRLLEDYEGLLAAAVAYPEGAVARLPLRHGPPRQAPAAPAGAPGGDGAPGGLRLEEAERLVAAVWRDLLGVDRVGPEDAFFEIGGHSLLALRAQRRLSDALGRDVALLDLFAYPTPRALARRLAGSGAPEFTAHPPALAAVQARAERQRAARAARERPPLRPPAP